MKKKMNIDYVGKKKYFFILSLTLIVLGLIFNIIFGTQMDIQFKGGTMVSYTFQGDIDKDEAAKLVEDTIGQQATVSITDDRATNSNKMSIDLPGDKELTPENQDKLSEAMSEKYADNQIEFLEANSVDPTMGSEFFAKCMVAVGLAAIFLILYIGIRFRKIGGISAGIMAIIALLHDITIVYFVFVVTRIPVDDNFIAVILTILGYSINSTIVIYDRIRENRRLMGPKAEIGEVVNRSINQSFTRSIFTSATTFVAIGTVAVVAIITGVTSIISFALPMMVGIVCGCYTSLCIAGPLWVTWRRHKLKKQEDVKVQKAEN
ncbi:protein translocase subunit SecF [[Clostridium] leptum]|nr:protein translocase subunit SecF [[Clostridium] leptum]